MRLFSHPKTAPYNFSTGSVKKTQSGVKENEGGERGLRIDEAAPLLESHLSARMHGKAGKTIRSNPICLCSARSCGHDQITSFRWVLHNFNCTIASTLSTYPRNSTCFRWVCSIHGFAMASIVAASTVAAPAAFATASSDSSTSRSTSTKAFAGLKSATLCASKAQTLSSVQNGSRVQCMQVWNPIGQTKFETFSYLPPLSDDAIAKQVEYMI
uniref:Ribulose-bisphosphate carboxylase n=1 Tax=Physcomitrium patens TaxID=3218 RepID=A0A7I3Z3V7_PHYPA